MHKLLNLSIANHRLNQETTALLLSIKNISSNEKKQINFIYYHICLIDIQLIYL